MLEGWVRQAIRRSRIGQAELSRRLSDALGRSIDRAAVNKMVKGGRGLAADELLAIAEITGTAIPGSALTPVPVLSWVSAGKLIDAESQIPVEDVPLLAFADLGHGEFFALRVEGDSMDRVSPDGSVIVVNREDRDLVADRCYVFSWRGETTYKLWRPEPPHLAPHSWNAANKPHFIKKTKDFEVIGRVRRTLLDL